MKEGKIPYLDMFDHKGPILYWIEYLGLLIPGKNYFGIWIIEAINMIITVALMCKLGGTITQRKSSIFLARETTLTNCVISSPSSVIFPIARVLL